MAERISHTVTPPKIGPDAHEELERLLQTMHEHGVLRFANDVVAANPQIAQVLVGGLQKEGTLNAIQNASVLGMALSTIEPRDFYRVTFALRDGLQRVSQHSPEDDDGDTPGVTGAYRMLHDETLWHALTPLLDGLKAFAERLDKPVDKPVTDFTGKPTDGP
ncbi:MULTISPECIES: DUF1641 domain-containing protein [Halomonadaceae]|uniref:DUF1641 domain-containing protein n=1 Tax=Modicisalibacter zincidurans TaxID=1178777 RepID=A0ABP9RF77_9GAMM|nr:MULTISPECIES: DUF1641 domain-containing protein [Halomonas]MCD6009487.1 DUF1641 domain-containing protein [Halomonas sp. IOP_31]